MTKRIFRAILLVAVLVLLLSLFGITGVLYRSFLTEQNIRLQEEVTLAGKGVELNGIDFLQALAIKEVRITWVAEDGRVLYDTKAEADTMDNHEAREEIKRALVSGTGESSRYSATLLEKTYYYALRLSDGSVLRVSAGLDSFFSLLFRSLVPLLIVLLLAVLLSGLLAQRMAKRIVNPLNELDLEYPLENNSYEELSPILGKMNKQRKQIEEQQMSAEQNRREFTANVTHELKTPLQSIIGSAELLETGLVKPEDTARFVGHIRAEATRLVTLINDIIRLSQLDEGAQLPMEAVDLYEVALEVTEALKPLADRKNVRLAVNGSSTIMCGVRRYIYEIIYNLCDNSIRYNKEEGNVVVAIAREENHVILKVADTGIGIAAEHHARVYERFYRVDKSHSKETGGTGLGLSIVKHAVQYHDGQMKLESVPGGGTTVTVEF